MEQIPVAADVLHPLFLNTLSYLPMNKPPAIIVAICDKIEENTL